MKQKSFLFATLCLFVSHAMTFCCWGTLQTQIDFVFPNINPASGECVYSAVDLTNGFTITSFTATKTSLVLRAEWPTNMVFEVNSIDLLYKHIPDALTWGYWGDVPITNPSQGWVEFEVPFHWFTFYDGIGKELPPVSFFSVQKSAPDPEEGWVLVPDGEDEQSEVEAEVSKAMESSPNHEEDVIATSEAKSVEKQNGSHRPLLYASIALALFAVFFFLRKTFSKR